MLGASFLVAGPTGAVEWRLAADLDGDARADLLQADAGSPLLRLVDADGVLHERSLPGPVTALVVGELHRPDGLPDLAVAVRTVDGPAVLVLSGPRGAWRATVQRVAVDGLVQHLALGAVDGDVAHDLALVAGAQLDVLHGGDQFHGEAPEGFSRRTRVALERPVHALALVDGQLELRGAGATSALRWQDGALRGTQAFAAASAKGAAAVQFVVNSSNDVDDGSCNAAHCSLREAILAANANVASTSAIAFDIPALAGAIPTIAPTAPLPTVVAPVAIDGSTQPAGFVELSGSNRSAADPAEDGLVVAGSGSLVRGLVINRFNGAQLHVTGNQVSVLGNRIGTSADGSQGLPAGEFQYALHVQGSGVVVGSPAGTTPGGGCTGDCNLIAGSFYGMRVDNGASATVQGNHFGIDVGGTLRLAGTSTNVEAHGLLVFGGPGAGEGNVLANNGGSGVALFTGSEGSVLQGNRIGTDASGTTALGVGSDGVAIYTSDVLVGGTAGVTAGGPCTGACNVIAGGFNSHAQGIEANGGARRLVVQGNHVGVDASGLAGLGNDGGGVLVREDPALVGGSVAEAGNVVGANARYGIAISDGTSEGPIRVLGNLVGVGADGVTPLPNGLGVAPDAGVSVGGLGDLFVGGPGAGEGNVIAHNPRGVVYDAFGSDPPDVRGNAIFANDGLGIDLFDDGVTADGDPDVIGHTNMPQLASVLSQDGGTQVSGQVALPSGSPGMLDFYSDAACDDSGHGEGAVFLGSAAVAAGPGPFQVVLPVSVPVGTVLTATATTAANGTSEFSACANVQAAGAADLSIALSSASAAVAPGAVVTFALHVQHLSGPSLSDATATLLMPAGSTFVAATGAACSSQPGVVICQLPVLAAGGEVEVALQVRLSAALVDGQQVAASATVGSFVDDPVPTNNSAGIVLPVDAIGIFADGFEPE